MTGILLVVQIILSIMIVTVVLLQKSSSIGLGAYSGSNESLFGAKGPANFMAKITIVLGILFLANTISLGYLYNNKSDRNKSVLDNIEIPQNIPINTPNIEGQIPLSSPLFNQPSQETNPLLQKSTTGTNPLSNTKQGDK